MRICSLAPGATEVVATLGLVAEILTPHRDRPLDPAKAIQLDAPAMVKGCPA